MGYFNLSFQGLLAIDQVSEGTVINTHSTSSLEPVMRQARQTDLNYHLSY